MGDFNPNTPHLRGMEWRPASSRTERMDSASRALVQRFRPGAVTPVNDHVFLSDVEGNPGLAVEYVSSIAPAVTETDYFPGTDTGSVVTGWTDQAGSTANFSELDDQYDTSDYHKNSAALSASSTLDLLFRGNASALSGVRVLSIELMASIKLTTATANGDAVRVHGILDLSGTRYAGGGAVDVPKTGRFSIYRLSKWRLNPSTDLPWTMAQANALVAAAGTDEFGIRLSKGRVAAGGFQVSGMWLRVATATENRLGFYYLSSPPRRGWTELALTSPAAFSANTWYYRVLYPLTGNPENYFEVPVLQAATAVEASSGSATGEHREVSVATLTGPGGVGLTSVERPGAMLPALIDTGSIISQSNPYAALANQEFYSGATANRGGEITTVSGTSYAALRLPVGWQDENRRPDAPLVVELRTGVGALTGGGTLRATAILDPASTSSGAVADRRLLFPTYTPGATQVIVLIKSDATSGRGWLVPRLDTRSDLIGSGTTLNEIEKASFGPSSGDGQTDSWFSGGTEADRYDVPVALIAAPTAPSGFSATPVAASSSSPPLVFCSWSATALGSAFGAYRVYRRPSRLPAAAWTLVAELDVPTGYTAATVEAQHTTWVDYHAGWAVAGGQWAEGWDYHVRVVSGATGLESGPSTIDSRNQVTPDTVGWLACNQAPWLNLQGVAVLEPRSTQDFAKVVRRAAGRDLAVVTTPLELPPRVLSGRWEFFDRIGEDQARYLLAAAAGGRTVAMHRVLGDRILGDLDVDEVRERPAGAGESVPITVVETTRTEDPSNYNRHAGLVLDGSSQYVTTGSAAATLAALDPAAGGFTLFCYVAPPNAASKALVATGAPGAGLGCGLVSFGSDQVLFIVQGASATVLAVATAASLFDGQPHVLVGTSSTTQVLYMDGTSQTLSGAGNPGSLAGITLGMGFGSSATGASFAALAPGLAWGQYNRELTATEVTNLTNYLRGVPGYRAPAGAAVFYDLRDDRCWPGFGTIITDLSGSDISGTVVGSPATRGIPWPLSELERF